MRLKFFSIPVLDPADGENALNAFLAQHLVASVDRELVADGSASFWAVCVTYVSGGVSGGTPKKKSRIDYREVLPPEQFAVYAELRRLRKELAERDGVPLYNVFTNEQMAEMIRQQIYSSEELGALAGVGPARVAKYGPAFLKRLEERRARAINEEGGDAPNDDPAR